ncbi:MAG: helix-turn-helix domain-containing protein [Methanomicrobiales archaeon]|nr:helix-turn-helix domain-containing protein [Methanomicrobiales archaeon]
MAYSFRFPDSLSRVLSAGFLTLLVAFCLYATLNSITLLLFGDPSVHHAPRLFHPPEIMLLHYLSLISPSLGQSAITLLFLGMGFFACFGFRRLTRKTTLNHQVREGVLRFIQTHPGCHFSRLMRELVVNRGTLLYHINQLKKFGMINRRKDGVMTRYYPGPAGTRPAHQTMEKHWDNPVRCLILFALQSKDPIRSKDLMEQAGISGPALAYHIRLLSQDGLVIVRRDAEQAGRPAWYSLTGTGKTILDNYDKATKPPPNIPSAPLQDYHLHDQSAGKNGGARA